jgi:hypothetical protein
VNEGIHPDGTVGDGSSELRVIGKGLPAPAAYALDLTYTATPHL